jgi:hypothetical protein
MRRLLQSRSQTDGGLLLCQLTYEILQAEGAVPDDMPVISEVLFYRVSDRDEWEAHLVFRLATGEVAVLTKREDTWLYSAESSLDDALGYLEQPWFHLAVDSIA